MAVDRVQPLKIEATDTGGDESDQFPTAVDRNEDFLDCRGLAVQNATSSDDVVRVERDSSNNLLFVDPVVPGGTKTLTQLASGSGMTPEDHRVLDQLVHDLDESYYEEYTYSGNEVTNITVWTSSGKTTKVREQQYSYSSGKVTQEVIIQYNGSGVEVERLTLTYAYTGSKITSVTSVRA